MNKAIINLDYKMVSRYDFDRQHQIIFGRDSSLKQQITCAFSENIRKYLNFLTVHVPHLRNMYLHHFHVVSLSVCQSVSQSGWLSFFLAVCLSVHPSVLPPVCSSIHPPIHSSIHPSIHPFIHPSINFIHWP